MGILLLSRCILASVATLALSHAAIAQGTQCPTHEGRLVVQLATAGISQLFVDYVKPASTGYAFGGSQDPNLAATFSFEMCTPGDTIQLKCTNCDASGDSVVAVFNSDLGADGNTPSDWVFYNAGPNPDWNLKSISYPFVYSSSFTLGADNVISPVTYYFDGNSQEIQLTAEFYAYEDELVFTSGTDNGWIYSIVWEES